jgi:hypothetical protein
MEEVEEEENDEKEEVIPAPRVRGHVADRNLVEQIQDTARALPPSAEREILVNPATAAVGMRRNIRALLKRRQDESKNVRVKLDHLAFLGQQLRVDLVAPPPPPPKKKSPKKRPRSPSPTKEEDEEEDEKEQEEKKKKAPSKKPTCGNHFLAQWRN